LGKKYWEAGKGERVRGLEKKRGRRLEG